MKLDIQKFGFWVEQGASQQTANNIVSAHQDIVGQVKSLDSGFINQVNTVWYSGDSNKITRQFSEKVNSDIVRPLQGNFETLLSNYIGTVNNLLSESGETISQSPASIQSTSVSWKYSAGSKNILPDVGELGSFVSANAVPKLMAIKSKAQELVGTLQGAGDMDAASKSAMVADVRKVAGNAEKLAEEVKTMFTKDAEQEEKNVQNVQKANQQRN